MQLSPRQSSFYVYTADIWRANLPSAAVDAVAYTKIVSGLPCLYSSSADWEEVTASGLTDANKLPLLETIAFALNTDVRDQDRIQLASAPTGSADVGKWFAVVGEPQRNGWRANRIRVFVKLTSIPEGA